MSWFNHSLPTVRTGFLCYALALTTNLCAAAQTPPAGLTITAILESIPPCALPCVVTGIGSAKCSVIDVQLLSDCMCTNVTLQSDMSTCVQTACKFSDQLLAVNTQNQICAAYPKESRVHEVKTVAIATVAISIPVMIARCAARLQLRKSLWLDDWISIGATIFLLAIGGIEIASALLGFGLHYWNVEVANATALLQLFYSVQIFYILVQIFAKVAILTLYTRVFKSSRPFRWTAYGCMAFMVGHGAIFIFVVVFQCNPIASVWDRGLQGKCLNVNAVGYAGAIMAVVEDIVLMILPIPELRKLQISGWKRMSVAIMFSVASFATVASMVRLKYIVQFSKTYDTTWDNVDIVIWSLIELLCAVVCGSLPALRPWFGSLIPSITITWKRSRDGANGDLQLNGHYIDYSSSRRHNPMALGDFKSPIYSHSALSSSDSRGYAKSGKPSFVTNADDQAWGISIGQTPNPTLPQMSNSVTWSGAPVQSVDNAGNSASSSDKNGPAIQSNEVVVTRDIKISTTYYSKPILTGGQDPKIIS